MSKSRCHPGPWHRPLLPSFSQENPLFACPGVRVFGRTSKGTHPHLRVCHCPKRMGFERQLGLLPPENHARVSTHKVRLSATCRFFTEQDFSHLRSRSVSAHNHVNCSLGPILKGDVDILAISFDRLHALVPANINTCGKKLAEFMSQETLDDTGR